MFYFKGITMRILSLVYVVIIAIFMINEVSAETTKILWLTDIPNDEKKFLLQQPDSIDSEINNLILNTLTKEYELSFQVVQIPRINLLLQTKKNACVSNRIKTPQRQRYSIYSTPIDLYLGYHLYYLKSKDDIPKTLLDKNNRLISLTSLFKTFPDRVLAISKGRSYGKYFDEQFTTLDKKNLYSRGGSNRYESIGKMLLKGRIDYLVEFPEAINTEMNLEQNKLDLKAVGIVNSPKYILGHVACSDTPTGHKIINRINKILAELYPKEAFYQAHTRYLNNTDIPVFNRYYQQVFHTTILHANKPH